MHFCTAKIAIGGDLQNVMYRDPYSPISWPEVEVLTFVHGDGSVQEITPIAEVEQSSRAERERLIGIYGEEPLKELWGGRNGPGTLTAPEARLKPGMAWFNPISRRVEAVEGAETPETAESGPFGADEPQKLRNKGK